MSFPKSCESLDVEDLTPFIDSLAARGVVFENTLATAPWTRASMASAITGLYPRVLDIEEPSTGFNNRQLPDSFVTLAEALRAAGYYTVGITANPNTHSLFGFDQGFDGYEDTGRFFWRNGYSSRMWTADNVNNVFLEILERDIGRKKFFAHLTYVDVHFPLSGHPGGGKPETTSVSDAYVTAYDGRVRHLDRALADLLGRLEAMGHRDLLVVITSDHGEAWGRLHEGDVYHGLTTYNETIWVPYIMYHPSLESVAGRRQQRVDLACLKPTLLDLLGITHEPVAGGGRSLEDIVYDASSPGHDPYHVTETCFLEANQSALLLDHWKMIATYEPGDERIGEPHAVRRELYRIDEDWDEQRNLAGDMGDRVAGMSELLAGWQAAHSPYVTAESLDVALPEEVLEELRTLGYIK